MYVQQLLINYFFIFNLLLFSKRFTDKIIEIIITSDPSIIKSEHFHILKFIFGKIYCHLHIILLLQSFSIYVKTFF